MKTMTCNQLGGACDLKFQADTFDEIADLSKKHGMDMFQKSDQPHLDAMDKMRNIMKSPNGINQWFEEKKNEFDQLAEDQSTAYS